MSTPRGRPKRKFLGELKVRCLACGSPCIETWYSDVPDTGTSVLRPAPVSDEMESYRELARWAIYDLRPDYGQTTQLGNRVNPYEGPYFEMKERLLRLLAPQTTEETT